MNVLEDPMGHVTVYCGWNDYDEETPQETTPQCTILAVERDTDRLILASFMKGKWCDINTLDQINVKYWIRVPSLPTGDDEESS